jgi:hypothetical protein
MCVACVLASSKIAQVDPGDGPSRGGSVTALPLCDMNSYGSDTINLHNFFLCVIHLYLLNCRTIHLFPYLLMMFYFQCYKTISVYFYFVFHFLQCVCPTCMITNQYYKKMSCSHLFCHPENCCTHQSQPLIYVLHHIGPPTKHYILLANAK